MGFIDELRWRGMLHDFTPGVEEELSKGMLSGYIGFDPTSDSLHIGNLVQIMTLVHFQRCGHKPFVLVGGATGMVGDPSGKSSERVLLTEDVLVHNQKSVTKQLTKFLNFEKGENKAEVVNNYDWFKEFNFLEFLRNVGKHISVNYMMAKDSVKNRMETGISFTEFSYQLIQGYDYYYLWKNKNCKLQLGGSDQWGNITTGIELIRRKGGGDAFAITTPLITKADGTKFGKSESGNVWLDAEKTSPYQFYQYWINASDEDAAKYLKIFSIKTQEEIQVIIDKHAEAPHERFLQKNLAQELTILVHSAEDLQQVEDASAILFGSQTTDKLNSISEKMLMSIFEGVPSFSISKSVLENGISGVELLAETTSIFPSKGEARKMIQANGLSINKEKINLEELISKNHLLQEKYILVQKGKKNYFLIIAQ